MHIITSFTKSSKRNTLEELSVELHIIFYIYYIGKYVVATRWQCPPPACRRIHRVDSVWMQMRYNLSSSNQVYTTCKPSVQTAAYGTVNARCKWKRAQRAAVYPEVDRLVKIYLTIFVPVNNHSLC
jgi:hypothetical protein